MQIDTVLGSATALSGLHSSLTGDWQSSTGALTYAASLMI